MEYPEAFIQEVKELFPRHSQLAEDLDEGSPAVGEFLAEMQAAEPETGRRAAIRKVLDDWVNLYAVQADGFTGKEMLVTKAD